jgi:hypothetical protein
MGAVEQLRGLRDDRRFLEAGVLLDALRAELSKRSGSAVSLWDAWDAPGEAQAALSRLLSDGGELEARIHQFRRAQADLSSEEGECAEGSDWEVIRDEAGLSVLLRRQSATHSRTAGKVVATLDGVRAADCMLMWREASLYPNWFPFVSGGKMLGEVDPGEVYLQLFIETSFINVDMPLRGVACDDMARAGDDGQRSGCMLLSCRPPPDWPHPLPTGVLPPTNTSESGAFKLLGSWSSATHIDVMIQPVGEGSVRMVFQMADAIPAATPSWVLKQIVENALGSVFGQMEKVARRMAVNDPACAHTAHVNSKEMVNTKRWYEKAMQDPLR